MQRGEARAGEAEGRRAAAPRRMRALLVGLAAALMAACGGGDVPAQAEGGHASVGLQGASPSPVILVTGSTDGLGRELALRLASSTGAHLVIHGRNVERGHGVVAEIEAEGIGSASFYRADFASLDEVRALAAEIRRDHDRLDVLVNNAGVGPGAPGHERVITGDGHELRFQVNYLAGFLLTHELLPLLRASAPSRIVNVASRSQQPIDFDDLRLDRGYTGSLAYGRSKLAQILFTFDLAEELEGTGVSVFAVHPAGAMDTGLVRETGGTPQTPVSRGVESVYRAVTGEGLENGTYFHELEPAPAHDQAYDPEARRRLREASERAVEEVRGDAVGGARAFERLVEKGTLETATPRG